MDLQEAHQRKAVGLATDDPLYTSQVFSIRSFNLMPVLGLLGAIIGPARYDREFVDEDTDDSNFGISEEFQSCPDGGERPRDGRAEDESTILEVPRPRDAELGLGL